MVTREDSACPPTALKVCRRCETAKPIEAFRTITVTKPDRKPWTGPHSKCRDCERAIGKRHVTEPTECSTCHTVQPPSDFSQGQLVCRSCRNGRAKGRTPDDRQAERARRNVKLGKVYRTRDEITQAALERVHAEKASRVPTIASQRRILRQLLGLLLKDRCAAEGRKADAVAYQHRYRTDAAFRDREIARTWKRKAASGVMRTDGRTTRVVHHDGTLPGTVIQSLFADAVDCPYCRKAMDPREKTLDHVIPVSRGGAHSITNVTVCCRQCNTVKHARTPEEMGWTNPLTIPSVRAP